MVNVNYTYDMGKGEDIESQENKPYYNTFAYILNGKYRVYLIDTGSCKKDMDETFVVDFDKGSEVIKREFYNFSKVLQGWPSYQWLKRLIETEEREQQTDKILSEIHKSRLKAIDKFISIMNTYELEIFSKVNHPEFFDISDINNVIRGGYTITDNTQEFDLKHHTVMNTKSKAPPVQAPPVQVVVENKDNKIFDKNIEILNELAEQLIQSQLFVIDYVKKDVEKIDSKK